MVLSKHSSGGWYVVAAAALAVIAAVGWSVHDVDRLRAAERELLAQQRALRALQAERERLLAEQPTDADWARLRSSHVALDAARAELAALRARESRQTSGGGTAASPQLEVGAKVAIARCQPVGNQTPQALLETALWAAAGGNVRAFADAILLIDSSTQREAAKLLASMPEAVRQEYATPEQLIAFLTVRDIPLTSIQLREVDPLEGWPFQAAAIQARMEDDQGKWAQKTLLFGNKGDGWKLVVSRDVIAKYAQAFATPTTTGH